MQTEQLVSRNIYTYTYMHIITMKKRVWIRKKAMWGIWEIFEGVKDRRKDTIIFIFKKLETKS